MSTGPSGYPDFQRTDNYDPGAATAVLSGVGRGSLEMPPRPCSEYESIAIAAACTAGMCGITVSWTDSTPAATSMGQVNLTVDSAIPTVAQFLLPNLGPTVSLLVTEIGGAGLLTLVATVLLCNRTAPTLSPVVQGVVVSATPAIAAGGATIITPSAYAGATSQFMVTGGSQGVTAEYQTLTFAAVYVPFWRTTVAAGVTSTGAFRIPPGAFRVNMINTSAGVANNSATIIGTQSLAGS